MNRMRYRICLIVAITAVVLAGIWLCARGEEEKQPFKGSLLVEHHREVRL